MKEERDRQTNMGKIKLGWPSTSLMSDTGILISCFIENETCIRQIKKKLCFHCIRMKVVAFQCIYCLTHELSTANKDISLNKYLQLQYWDLS